MNSSPKKSSQTVSLAYKIFLKKKMSKMMDENNQTNRTSESQTIEDTKEEFKSDIFKHMDKMIGQVKKFRADY